jgi:hypothetical protein
MKTTTPELLAAAYAKLYPAENRPLTADTFITFGHWLIRYESDPCRAIACANWSGKVTRALFHDLQIKLPRTKALMLVALKGVSERSDNYSPTPTG